MRLMSIEEFCGQPNLLVEGDVILTANDTRSRSCLVSATRKTRPNSKG